MFNNDKFSVKKGIKTLIVPYLSIVGIYGVASLFDLSPNYSNLKTFIYVLITGRCKLLDKSIGAGPAWFFIALFVARIYLHLILKIKNVYVQWIAAFLFCSFSFVFSFIDFVLPMQLDISGMLNDPPFLEGHICSTSSI